MKVVKNYYFILGISRDAYPAEIEAAYESWKAIAAEDEFQALMAAEKAEAYRHLADPELRKQYDGIFFGTTPQPNAGGNAGNVHHFRSAEAGVSLQIEFNKQIRKQKTRRKLIKTTAAALVLIAALGYGITRRDKFFSKAPQLPVPEVPTAPALFREPPPVTEPESAPAGVGAPRATQPVIRTYEVQTGGVIIRDRAPCRPQPSYLSRATAAMPIDAAVLVTREARDENGNLWYYVRSSQFEGWASAGDIRVYKY